MAERDCLASTPSAFREGAEQSISLNRSEEQMLILDEPVNWKLEVWVTGTKYQCKESPEDLCPVHVKFMILHRKIIADTSAISIGYTPPIVVCMSQISILTAVRMHITNMFSSPSPRKPTESWFHVRAETSSSFSVNFQLNFFQDLCQQSRNVLSIHWFTCSLIVYVLPLETPPLRENDS